MLIQRMSAVFGRLRNETLQLQDGLNIIEAPNETGKSTWCAFLTAMLYGINSRERDKAGFIADKNRYAPWDGGSMSGRLECHADGADLTITRATRRQTAPMADFQAVYTSTASPVDGLTGTNCGETLLGVSREVFERSAFIRQSGLAITQDAGLERRVASLISSGDEDTSYTEAYDALKKQLNRRRFNKSGQLPALEAELAEVQQQLDSSVQLQQQLADALERSQSLESDVQALSDELAQHDQWEAAQKRRQLAALTTDADTAAQRVHSLTQQLEEDRVPDMETIGRLRGAIVNLETVRKNVEKARTDRDEAMKALLRAEKNVNDSPFAGQTAESARKEAQGTSSDRVPGPIAFRELAIFFLFLATAGGIFALLYSQLSVLGALGPSRTGGSRCGSSRHLYFPPVPTARFKKAVQCRPHEAVRHHGYQRDYCLCGCLYRRRGGPGRRAGGSEHQIRHRRRLLQYPDHQRTGNFVGGPALCPRRL